MIQLMLYSLTFTISIVFLFMSHPLSMGLILLIQTLLISLMTGLMTKSFWFSYILFLIFVGGMLVMFIYVTSLASNEMFSLSIKLTMVSALFLFFMMICTFIFDKNISMSWFQNNEMTSIMTANSFFKENSLSLNKLYNFPTNLINIMLMNYLLITLVAVVKITKLSKGPLRLMF